MVWLRPSEGSCRAIEAHRPAAPSSRVDPGIAYAVERQNAVMRELSQRSFPNQKKLADEQPTPIDSAILTRRREFAATETAALHRARAERSGPGPR